MPFEVDYVGEGRSDEAVARRLIAAAGGVAGISYGGRLSGSGKASLDGRLRGLNAGVIFGRPILVLRDLDQDAPCPAALVARLVPKLNPGLLLRICVREVEAWLLADRDGYARYAGMRASLIPQEPEALAEPKATILAFAPQSRALRRAMEDGGKRGLASWQILGEFHAEFAAKFWQPESAARSGRAPSLQRSILRLRAAINAA